MKLFQKLQRLAFGNPGPVLSPDEATVLDVLGPNGGDAEGDWRAFKFSDIDAQLRIGRDRIRNACRSLAEKGLAAYEAVLWTEEGEMYGAGYRATLRGREHWSQQEGGR